MFSETSGQSIPISNAEQNIRERHITQIASIISQIESEQVQRAKRNITHPLDAESAFRIDAPNRLREMATKNKCEINSLEVMRRMAINSPGEMDKYILLRSMGVYGSSAFKNGDWDWHTYFLMHAPKNDMWYAGSPANFEENTRPTIMDEIFSSQSLLEVLSLIKANAGGDWPSENFILSHLSDRRLDGLLVTDREGNAHLQVALVSHGKDGQDRILDNYISKQDNSI